MLMALSAAMVHWLFHATLGWDLTRIVAPSITAAIMVLPVVLVMDLRAWLIYRRQVRQGKAHRRSPLPSRLPPSGNLTAQ